MITTSGAELQSVCRFRLIGGPARIVAESDSQSGLRKIFRRLFAGAERRFSLPLRGRPRKSWSASGNDCAGR